MNIFQILENFIQIAWKESSRTRKCFAHEHQLVSEWYSTWTSGQVYNDWLENHDGIVIL